MTDRAYLKVFHEARGAAFTEEESASPLIEVPYALRHEADLGRDPAQIAWDRIGIGGP
jgi:hypothetical protein